MNGFSSHSRPMRRLRRCDPVGRGSRAAASSGRPSTDCRSSSGGAASDGVAEERVAGEAELAVDDEARRRRPSAPGVASASIRRPPVSTGPAVTSTPYRSTSSSLPSDVIGVAVRQEQVRRRQPLALDGGDRAARAARRCRRNGWSSLLRGQEIRVREPGRVEASLDEHPKIVRNLLRLVFRSGGRRVGASRGDRPC